MSERENFDLTDEHAEAPLETAVRPRTTGTPLSAGANRHAPQSSAEENTRRFAPVEPSRASENALAEAAESSNVQRAANILRSALPFLQRLLPLLDGNFATAMANLLASRRNPQAARPSEKLDLAPIEDGLAELRSKQHSLRLQVTEQNVSLKRIEDRLEMVREATERNTIEQQEVIEDLKAFGNKIKIVAMISLLLAAASFFMMLALFLHLKKMLP